MGNRAVITSYVEGENFGEKHSNRIGIYVHWNGGYDSVSAFLKFCEIKGFRYPEQDSYGWARLCQVIANYFGGEGLSVGIDTINHLDLDNGDNGVFLIKEWKIVGRAYNGDDEQKEYKLLDMLKGIDNAQPKDMKITTEEWKEYKKKDIV
jgi:hypothetical protein